MKAEGSIQGCPWLYWKFKVGLGYVRPGLKKQTNEITSRKPQKKKTCLEQYVENASSILENIDLEGPKSILSKSSLKETGGEAIGQLSKENR